MYLSKLCVKLRFKQKWTVKLSVFYAKCTYGSVVLKPAVCYTLYNVYLLVNKQCCILFLNKMVSN